MQYVHCLYNLYDVPTAHHCFARPWYHPYIRCFSLNINSKGSLAVTLLIERRNHVEAIGRRETYRKREEERREGGEWFKYRVGRGAILKEEVWINRS